MSLMLNGKVLERPDDTIEYFKIIDELERGELVSVERLMFALRYGASRLEMAAEFVENRKYGAAFVIARAALHYGAIVAAVFEGDDPRKVKE